MDEQGRSAVKVDEDTHWEEAARTRWGSYISAIEERVIIKAAQMAGEASSALEVGCEGGRWTKLLIGRGWEMTCTDVSEESLATCQARNPAADCILVQPGDTTLPVATARISLLLCIEVFEVVSVDWFRQEAYRVLKDGGLFVGVFNNQRSFRGMVRHLVSWLKHSSYDSYQVAYPTWKGKASQQGLKMLYEEGLCWFPFTRYSNARAVPFFTKLERSLKLHRLPDFSPWIVFIAKKETTGR